MITRLGWRASGTGKPQEVGKKLVAVGTQEAFRVELHAFERCRAELAGFGSDPHDLAFALSRR